MDKDETAFIIIVAVIISGFLVAQKPWRREKPSPKEVYVEGTVHFDTPPPSLSSEYSDKEGTVNHIGVYKYTAGELKYMYDYERIGTIKLEHFTGLEETTAHFENDIPYAENLCVGFLSGAPKPDDGYTRVEIDEDTENIELHYWNYVGPLPLGD